MYAHIEPYSRYKGRVSPQERQRMMDMSLMADGSLNYSIENTGNHTKLIGQDDNGFRSFAYFTDNIGDAKQSIRMEYVNKGKGE